MSFGTFADENGPNGCGGLILPGAAKLAGASLMLGLWVPSSPPPAAKGPLPYCLLLVVVGRVQVTKVARIADRPCFHREGTESKQ